MAGPIVLKFGVWEYLQGLLLWFVMTESSKTNIYRNMLFWTFFAKQDTQQYVQYEIR